MNTRWSIGKKLTAGFGLALVMLLIIGSVSYWTLTVLVENAAGWLIPIRSRKSWKASFLC